MKIVNLTLSFHLEFNYACAFYKCFLAPCDHVKCGAHARCNAEGAEAYCVCEDGWSYDPRNITAGCIGTYHK